MSRRGGGDEMSAQSASTALFFCLAARQGVSARVGGRVRLFELDDRAIALFDANNAVVFTGDHWRPASIETARSTLLNGTELSAEEFRTQFPSAAASLARLDVQDGGNKPN